MLDNVLLITIIFIIVTTIVDTFIGDRIRDRCLTSFRNYIVTLLEKDGKPVFAEHRVDPTSHAYIIRFCPIGHNYSS